MDTRPYQKARREGLKAYTAAIGSNRDPYLPVLEESVANLNQLTHIPIGVITVPLDYLKGSVSHGRSYAFADNFMPILEMNTEFCSKWCSLYESIAENGMREPAKVVEYFGQYYTIEGNKRVSVMKSMDAEYIDCDVTRVIPEHTDDPENIAYFEYCVFSRETKIYDLLFSRPGMYERLSLLPGMKTDGNTWSEDDILSLRKIWHYFRSSYRQIMRDRQAMADGDAFLLWLTAFGYKDVRENDLKRTEDQVRLMMHEFAMHDDSVSLVMDHEQSAPQPTLIGSLFAPAKIKAAFLYTRPVQDSAWNYWHDLGRLEVQEKLGSRVETAACVVGSRTDTAREIARLIDEGYTAIFATSPVMLNSCIEPSLEHPEVKLLNCSQLAGYYHVRTYYLRFYEAKFLLGMAAGILAENGKIGYIADYPIFGSPAMINAFAIGARMVNPRARVYLNWTSLADFDASEPFHDPEIRVICNRDLTAPNASSRDSGLYIRDGSSIVSMATLVPRWGILYRSLIERIQNGSYDAASSGDAVLNYWWGIASDVLDIVFSSRFDPAGVRLIRNLQNQFRDHSFTPFEGRLTDNTGMERSGADRRLTPAEVLCMDYLADNVIGDLPGEDRLAESAVALVRLQGIRSNLKPDISTISWNRK